MRSVLYFSYAIGLLGYFSACRPSAHSETDRWGDSLSFDPGFPLALSGVFQSSERTGRKEYVYFADPVTNKKLMLFSPKGALLHTVPLNAALDSLGQIGGLSIVDLDTIVLSSVYTNRIGIVDHDGRCLKVMDLTEQLVRPDGLAYELWHSMTTPFMIGKTACFEVQLVATSVEAYREPYTPQSDEHYKYYWLARNGPHFAALDLSRPEEEPLIRWGPVDPILDTVADIPTTTEIGPYACVNGLWFHFSTYSPLVKILDPGNMTPVRQFQVSSTYGPTYRAPIILRKDTMLDTQDSLNDRLSSGERIKSIRYDRPTGHYLVNVLHRVPRSTSDGRPSSHWNYSVLEYDSSFNLVRERTFTDGVHSLTMINLSNGTYVLRTVTRRDMVRGHYVFDKLILDAD